MARPTTDRSVRRLGDREWLRRELVRRYDVGASTSAWRSLRCHTKRLGWVWVLATARLTKQVLDLVLGAAALLALSPLLVVVAAAIKLESRGPVFFTQTRVGRWGRLFAIWKFRSMYVDAEARKAALAATNEMAGGVTFKMRDDPRITRVGRLIRRGSIDELPQLWNVLRGDMSLVGPRPPLPSEVAEYALSDRRRLEVKPGITCLWQVSGRSEIPFDRQVELDVEYIESHTLRQDLSILLRTIPAVLLGKGAY